MCKQICGLIKVQSWIDIFISQTAVQAEAWSDDMDLKGGLNLGAMLRSLQPVLKTDALGLLEEAIPQSSSQRTYPVVKPGGSAHTELSGREGLLSSQQI